MRAALLLLLLSGCATRKLVHAGDDYLASGHPEAAARSYAKALAAHPDDPKIQLKLARARLDAGDPADAVAPARAAAKAGEPGATSLLAQALLGTGAIDEARTLARTELERAPSPALHAVLAEAEFCAGDLPGALAEWDQAESASDPQLAARHAFTLAAAGQAEKARSMVALSEEQGDESVAVLLDAAATRLWLGDTDQGREDAETALSLDARLIAEDGLYTRRLADAERRRSNGDLFGAWRSLLGAYALQPDDVEMMRKIGSWWLADNQPARAIPWLERALSTPPYAAPPGAAGTVTVSRANEPGLEELHAARLELARDLAMAKRETGDRIGAAQALEIAVRSNNAATGDELFELGLAWQAAGRPNEANRAFVDAAALGHPASINAIARSLAAAGRTDEAVARCVSGLGTHPGNKDLSLTLAQLYLSRDEYKAAIQVLNTALRVNPDDRELSEMKARAEARVPAYR